MRPELDIVTGTKAWQLEALQLPRSLFCSMTWHSDPSQQIRVYS
jgi:hypothetical protein